MHRYTHSLCLALLSLTAFGCGDIGFDDVLIEAEKAFPSKNAVPTTVSLEPPSIELSESISIATFNIQVFGQSKMNNPDAMRVLTDVARKFDVMAIQEIRSSDQGLIPRFIEMINADGAQFDYLIGPRQGRSISREQYAFIYNTQKISAIDVGFAVPDESDVLHRPPVASRFQVRTNNGRKGFSFVLINTHTDPDETEQEIAALANVYKFVQKNMLQEDDYILLGDINVGEKDYAELRAIPNISWVISGMTTNTRGTKSYDNIFFDITKTTEYAGQGGVLDFKKLYDLTDEQALAVSDHFPVWGLFSSFESPATAFAARTDGPAVR